MLRGDIVKVAAGSGFGSKPRPALMMQADLIQDKNTFVVFPFTTELGLSVDWRPVVQPNEENGLRHTSCLMADVPVTVRREKIDGVIGRLSPSDMTRAERAVLLVLGFA